MDYKRVKIYCISLATGLSLLTAPLSIVHAQNKDQLNGVSINEVESSDENGGNDFIEIMNYTDKEIDISGWFVTDEKDMERVSEETAYKIKAGTKLAPGELKVLENTIDFDFGLGKSDCVHLYNGNDKLMDEFSYDGHAAGSYARVPDGTGEFVQQAPTKGKENKVISDDSESTEEIQIGQLVINEINSAPDDWVEVMNIGSQDLDISDYEIRDNSDDHRWRFKEGSVLKKGEKFLVKDNTIGLIYNDQSGLYEEGTFNEALGIGSGDSIRLYDKGQTVIDSYSWTAHASYNGDAAKASYGRYPDGKGSFTLMKETPGNNNDWYPVEAVINEIESNGETKDFVEIYNKGKTEIDLSGWYLMDNDEIGHAGQCIPVADGTKLQPGAYYVFENGKQFSFGLGSDDQITLYNKDHIVVAQYAWTSHAQGVYARIPDGTGDMVDFEQETKGEANIKVNPVLLNEIEPEDEISASDWIELYNPTKESIDISSLIVKNSKDSNTYTIPNKTTMKANSYYILTEEMLGFGFDEVDCVRLYDNDYLLAEVKWEQPNSTTIGLIKGKEYKTTLVATKGSANRFEGIPDVTSWSGSDEIVEYDKTAMFLEDSSGLDFFQNRLYACDNGSGTFWVLDAKEDGTLTYVNGFEHGKQVKFKKDAQMSTAKGPDTEGITVDGSGLVYLASERDNSNKGVNDNRIIMVDPMEDGTELIAKKEWNITDSLPKVSANMGIEAVEWVSAKDLNNTFYDSNKNKLFDIKDYSHAVANGVFFVALEDNGHVYAYILNEDESFVQVADIDTVLGGAMALDYDVYEKALYVATDNGYGNRLAKITWNQTKIPNIVHMLPAKGVDVAANNEGFAIAEKEYTKDGLRPFYMFQDGVKTGSLKVGKIQSLYKVEPETTMEPEESVKDKNIDKNAVETGDKSGLFSAYLSFLVSSIGGIYLIKKKKKVKDNL